MSDLCVFTANADPLLVESAERVGIVVKSYSPHWRGYVDGKLKEGVKFLSAQTEQFAMWVDGYDSLILKPEIDILARLQASGFATTIAAEANCWPDAHLAEKYPSVIGLPRYLNSGGFIGLRGEVMTAMHTAIQYASDDDDQRAWTAAYLAKAVSLQIDHGRRFFCSMGDGIPFPGSCVAHFNGRCPGRKEMWDAIR